MKKKIHLLFIGAGLQTACGYELKDELDSKEISTLDIKQVTCELCNKIHGEVETFKNKSNK